MSGKKVVRRRPPQSALYPGRRRWLWALPVLLAAGTYWLLREPVAAPEPPRRAERTTRSADGPQTKSQRRAEPAIRKPAARSVPERAAPGTAAAPTRPAAVAAHAPLVTTPKPAPRTAQLNMQVLQEAQKYGWVFTDEGETPCPPQRVRILWDVPGDLSDYDRGAYFEPLGPAPGETSTSVNGLLICDGYSFLYRGFEAYYDEDRGQWRVYPFPVIEPAPGQE